MFPHRLWKTPGLKKMCAQNKDLLNVTLGISSFTSTTLTAVYSIYRDVLHCIQLFPFFSIFFSITFSFYWLELTVVLTTIFPPFPFPERLTSPDSLGKGEGGVGAPGYPIKSRHCTGLSLSVYMRFLTNSEQSKEVALYFILSTF